MEFLRPDQMIRALVPSPSFSGGSLLPTLGGAGGRDVFAPTGSLIGNEMKIDVAETDDGYRLSADLPGVPKEDCKVKAEGQIITISAQRATESEDRRDDPGFKIFWAERSSTFMSRSLRMPEAADMKKIHCKMDNGVLSIEIAKHEGAKQPPGRTIDIQ